MSNIAKALSINTLKDTDLISKTKKLLSVERSVLCSFLINLAEIDVRNIYASAGYPSLFKYCVKEFNLCEGAAAKRIVVSRHAKIFPRLLDEIRSGRLHLSGAYLLCKNADKENFDTWLDKAQHKSKTEIEEMLRKEESLSKSIREYIRPVIVPIVTTSKSNVSQKKETHEEARSLFEENSAITPPNNASVPQKDHQDPALFEIRLGIIVKKEVYENLKKLQRLTGKDKLSDVIEKAITHYL